MFVPVWLYYLGTGTLMAVLTLWWALRARQFDDQDRARYLPLVGMEPGELERAPRPVGGATKLAMAVVLLAGAWVLTSTLVVVVRTLP
jgi:cbb3-type cytochrome oxidase maturation protein